MDTPAAVFPTVTPAGVPRSLPAATIRSVRLRNFAKEPLSQEKGANGNAAAYSAKLQKELAGRFGFGTAMEASSHTMDSLSKEALIRLSCFCCLGQSAAHAGRADVHAIAQGLRHGRLIGRWFDAPPPGKPLAEKAQRRRHVGYATKLATVVQDVRKAPRVKTLVMVHRSCGHKHLLRMMGKEIGTRHVRGFPAAKTMSERADEQLMPLLGVPHDSMARDGECRCSLCSFNRPSGGPSIMVADSKECGEGVSFLGVRRDHGLHSTSARLTYDGGRFSP